MSNGNPCSDLSEERVTTPPGNSDPETPLASDLTPKLKRVELSNEQFEDISLEELKASWKRQETYINYIESLHNSYEEERKSREEAEEKLRQQVSELSLRERVLMRRLAVKERDLQEYATQLSEAKGSQAVRSSLLDPTVNLLLQRLRQELADTRLRLDDTQNELSAWKFTPDSNTGKRLMAKCRLLYQENEELGAMVSKGRLAKLEGDLALQKSFSEEVKKSQSELEELLQDLDEDVEGMQSTIYFLQQELKKAKETAASLEAENSRLRRAEPGPPGRGRSPAAVNGLPPSSHSSSGAAVRGGKWNLRTPPDSPPPSSPPPSAAASDLIKRTRDTDSDSVVNNNYQGQRKRTSSDASDDSRPLVKKPKQEAGSDDEVVTNGDKGGQ